MTDQPRSDVRELIWALFAGAPEGCAMIEPVWRRMPTLTIAGALAGLTAWATDVPFPLGPAAPFPLGPAVLYPLVGAVAGMALYVAANAVRVWPTWHGHCAECDLCSIVVDIPATRTRASTNAWLTAAGWLPDVYAPARGGNVDLCPTHRPQGSVDR